MNASVDAGSSVRTIRNVAKDRRFLMRVSEEELKLFARVGEALGCESVSQAVRFVMRQQYRELFGTVHSTGPAGATKARIARPRKGRLRGA